MDDKLSIKVNVAERYYPLKIERADEEKIRRAAKMINDRVLQYKQRYTDKDTQDFLAMAALQFVIRLLEHEEKLEVSSVVDGLSEVERDLDDFIERKTGSFK
ncbi:MAG TPA: cell division protein ZapA [Williamwhitmania sp.]|nr:cell division protein ZapA [Williamwhitmania sp.]